MKYPLILRALSSAWIAAGLFCSCQDPMQEETIALYDTLMTDSFTIGPLATIPEELSTLRILNDSVMYGYDVYGDINTYRKRGGVFRYHTTTEQAVPEGSFTFFHLDTVSNTHYMLAGRTLYHLSVELTPIDSLEVDHSTPYLGKDWTFTFGNIMPLLMYGDTFICNYTHREIDDFYDTYKEPALMAFSGKGQQARTFHTRPAGLSNYDAQFVSSHALIGDQIVKLYGPFDTLYVYSLKTRKEHKIPIGNRSYKVPEPLERGRLQDFGYLSRYLLSNFYYTAIFYNPYTGNSLLFYNNPVKVEGRNPTFKDQPLKAIVLDEQFRIIRYLRFEQNYFDVHSFFIYKNKGLAMPLWNNDPTHENTTFYTFYF